MALKWSRFTAGSRDQIQNEAPEPGPNPGSATTRKHDFCVICLNFLSLKLAIIAIKTRHGALVQIYSLAVGVCCKSWGRQGRSFCNKHLRLGYKSVHQTWHDLQMTHKLNKKDKIFMFFTQILAGFKANNVILFFSYILGELQIFEHNRFYYTSLEDRKPWLADLTVNNHHVAWCHQWGLHVARCH